jgi:hypothetical protein
MFHSCYKDKGNYNYIELNNIDKIKGIEKQYSMYKFIDTLKINPVFSFDKKTNTDKYEYEWKLIDWYLKGDDIKNDTIKISTKKNLIFVAGIKIPYKKMEGIFTAKNLTTGVSKVYNFQLTVMNSYNYGTFILHKNGENSEITLIKTNGDIVENLYNKILGRNLIGSPLIMIDINSGWDKFLNIFTNGPDYGAVLDFLKLDYRYPISECFHGGAPVGTKISKVIKPIVGDLCTIIDGKVYFSSKAIGGKIPYLAVGYPDIDDNIDYIDKKGKFAHSIINGKIYTIGFNGALGIFKRDNHEFLMPGKCFHIATEAGGNSRRQTYRILIKNNNTAKEYVILAKTNYYGPTEYSFKSQNEFSAPELLTEHSLFAYSEVERYYFLTNDNKIYRYNYDMPNGKPELFYEFPKNTKISYFEMYYERSGYKNIEKHLIACTYNPNQTGKNASIYHIDRTGTLIKSFENICGKINSMVTRKP